VVTLLGGLRDFKGVWRFAATDDCLRFIYGVYRMHFAVGGHPALRWPCHRISSDLPSLTTPLLSRKTYAARVRANVAVANIAGRCELGALGCMTTG